MAEWQCRRPLPSLPSAILSKLTIRDLTPAASFCSLLVWCSAALIAVTVFVLIYFLLRAFMVSALVFIARLSLPLPLGRLILAASVAAEAAFASVAAAAVILPRPLLAQVHLALRCPALQFVRTHYWEHVRLLQKEARLREEVELLFEFSFPAHQLPLICLAANGLRCQAVVFPGC